MYDLVIQFFSSPLTAAFMMAVAALALLVLLLHHFVMMRFAKSRIAELGAQVDSLEHTASLSDQREIQIGTLRRELEDLQRRSSAEIDRIATTAQQEVANAERAGKLAKGRAYPNASRRIARGAFSHIEDAYVDGRPVTTVHFKNGSSCCLPVYWTTSIPPGTYIDIFLNFKTGVVHAEKVVGKAATDPQRKNVSYLALVRPKPREGEDKSN